jgi:hypothetical protein
MTSCQVPDFSMVAWRMPASVSLLRAAKTTDGRGRFDDESR